MPDSFANSPDETRENRQQRSDQLLEEHLQFTSKSDFPRPDQDAERRGKPRFVHSLPARVWDIDHEAFNFDCAVENISSSGVYLIVPWAMKVSAEISLVARLPVGPRGGKTAAIRGRVIRNESQPDGRNGIAIVVREYQFF